MNNFQIIEVHGHKHVLKPSSRVKSYFVQNGVRTELIPNPDYLNTGMCLCGILKAGQTLDEFIKEYNR